MSIVAIWHNRSNKSSRSGLGLLGCLIFGFLFWQERQQRTANNNNLENVQVRIRKADIELSAKTRAALMLKSESLQMENQLGGDALQNEASLDRLINTKSEAIELAQQVHVQSNIIHSLKDQENGLTASLENIEKDCLFLVKKLKHELKSGQMLQENLHSINLQLKSVDQEINSLKIALDDQEKVFNKHLEKQCVVEHSLAKAMQKIQLAEREACRSSECLCNNDDSVHSLTQELKDVISKHEICEKMLSELYKDLHDARQVFNMEMVHRKSLLDLKSEEAHTMSIELESKNCELETSMETLRKLRSEREDLIRASGEKQDILNNIKEQLTATQKMLNACEGKRASLLHALDMQQVREQSETDLHLAVSLELQGEFDIEGCAGNLESEKASKNRVTQELLEATEALRDSKNEVFCLQDTMKSHLTHQVQLEGDLLMLRETQQSYTAALKKEKRASAYAKKKLTQCEEVLAGEHADMKGLHKDLEQARKKLEDSKETFSSWASAIEKANMRGTCLEKEISLLRVRLEKETLSRKELEKEVGRVARNTSGSMKRQGMCKSNSTRNNTTQKQPSPKEAGKVIANNNFGGHQVS